MNTEKTLPKSHRSVRKFPALALAAVMSTVILTGCVTDSGNKELVGSAIGAGVGGLLGSKFGSGNGQLAATAGGVVLGAVLGNSIGSSLDRADQAFAARAQNAAWTAPIGDKIEWSNPETGNRGSVKPVREGYKRQSRSYCREYETEIMVDGEWTIGRGTACKSPQGDWQIQS